MDDFNNRKPFVSLLILFKIVSDGPNPKIVSPSLKLNPTCPYNNNAFKSLMIGHKPYLSVPKLSLNLLMKDGLSNCNPKNKYNFKVPKDMLNYFKI